MTDLTPEKLAEIKALAEKALSFGVQSLTDAFLAYRDYQSALSPDVALALVAEIEQAEARLEKAREDLRKYGKHTKPCILAGLVAGDHGQYAECTCGLDATLKGEPAPAAPSVKLPITDAEAEELADELQRHYLANHSDDTTARFLIAAGWRKVRP